MARWQPDTENRLRRAALDLFVEHGYDAVTVSDIAERASLTRRSFFRYFPDKREVLFAGSHRLVEEIEHKMDAVRPQNAPTEALRILAQAGTFLLVDGGEQKRRRRIIESSPELQERDRTKTAAIGTAIARSLARHGTDDVEAQLIGAICSEAFRCAYARALSDRTDTDFTTHLDQTLKAAGSFLTALPALASDR